MSDNSQAIYSVATPPDSTITLIKHPNKRPPLTLIPELSTTSDIEEGEITSQVCNKGYPLSPQSSLNVLQVHPHLSASDLRTIAIRLTNTAMGHTFQHLEACDEIQQLQKELTNLHTKISRESDPECPEGFEENRSRLPDFTLTASDNIWRQARYIQLGDGLIPTTYGTLGGPDNPIFECTLYATSRYSVDQPSEPLPMWFIDCISGKSAAYHQAMEAAREVNDWGLMAKMACYHEADTRILNIAAKMHALEAELSVVKAVCRQSWMRLEGAKAHHHLTELQALKTHRSIRLRGHAAVMDSVDTYKAGLRFGCGRPSF